jgi:hypothetical protein
VLPALLTSGETEVTCTTVNACGADSACSFPVTVRNKPARLFKQEAADLLRALPSTGHNEADNDIADADDVGGLAAATAAALAAGCHLDGANTDDGECLCEKAVDNVHDAETHWVQGQDKLADGDPDMAEYRFRQAFDDTVKVHDAVHWCE